MQTFVVTVSVSAYAHRSVANGQVYGLRGAWNNYRNTD